jgi:hypothetical protein
LPFTCCIRLPLVTFLQIRFRQSFERAIGQSLLRLASG